MMGRTMKFMSICFMSLSLVCAGDSFANDAKGQQSYEVVILNGRVVDPETGLDAVRNVAIAGNKIVAVTTDAISGKRIIDAKNRVVSPGFIDMHAHGQDILAGRVQAFDGVTTALDLEAGMLPVSDYYDQAAKEGRPINYGASVSWANARIATFLDVKPVADVDWFIAAFKHRIWQKEIASPKQQQKILSMVQKGLNEGGIGVGILVGYAPGTGHKEIFEVNKLAAQHGVPTYTHARYLSMLEPGSSFQGIAEVISAAAGAQAHTHISHLNSISLRDIPAISAMIKNAQAQGLKISTEAYPYGAGATGIGAALFRGDRWRERVGGVTANNFVVDGKRLTEEELAYYKKHKPNATTIVHFLEEDDHQDQDYLEMSVLFPDGVIASDGGDWRKNDVPIDPTIWPLPEDAWTHPRSAGTYAKFIGTYVRDQKKISLLEAIKRVSYGPAKIMQSGVPQMKYKGRIQVGADADIVIFDLTTIQDKATYDKPAQLSAGFDYVLVNGKILIDQGKLDTHALPGRPVRNAVKKGQ